MFASKNLTVGQLNALVKNLGGEGAVRKILDGTFEVTIERARRVLQHVAKAHVCGASRFVARAAFGSVNPVGVKFWLSQYFMENFLDKVEENIPAGELSVYRLAESSVDGPIRDELGEEEETFLAYIYELISCQPRGEAGPLLINGDANIFYVRDVNGKFWAVDVCWYSYYDEWCICATSLVLPRPWGEGYQVFSQVSSS